jgi:hypothetical protein
MTYPALLFLLCSDPPHALRDGATCGPNRQRYWNGSVAMGICISSGRSKVKVWVYFVDVNIDCILAYWACFNYLRFFGRKLTRVARKASGVSAEWRVGSRVSENERLLMMIFETWTLTGNLTDWLSNRVLP